MDRRKIKYGTQLHAVLKTLITNKIREALWRALKNLSNSFMSKNNAHM